MGHIEKEKSKERLREMAMEEEEELEGDVIKGPIGRHWGNQVMTPSYYSFW